MDNYIKVAYKNVKGVRHPKAIVNAALTELEYEEREGVILRNGEFLNTVLEQVKFMIEDDVITWGLEIKNILRKLEIIYSIDNIIKLLK